MPELNKIDHIHIYVPDPLEAEAWYREVMGFERVKALESWFVDGGPLTIANGGVHIAVFKKVGCLGNTVAFGCDSNNYHGWKQQLIDNKIEFREEDHTLSWSLYFRDPYGNPYEITTYDLSEN
ncbi:VOC family protein [Vibrio sp. SCSIO 43136]|uniref:VOC family protein n=1 Tax=Vibrio sp. SCSIO 43136 TaxID=2819101 RepID=UPI002076271C|nr:VOC family protein [Vibrio sp. SCSIO 43136]USD64041.1 VOC family protein [Vibrio sp. SCSIO 43136]